MATHASMETTLPYSHGERIPFWQSVPRWRRTTESEFLDSSWQTRNQIETRSKNYSKLYAFLEETLPDDMPTRDYSLHIKRDQVMGDVAAGLLKAPMSVKLTPYVLSRINWASPLSDPIFRQFIPLRSQMYADNPGSSTDSLSETKDSPVPGLVHRYPDKVLFLATSFCPVYCKGCTRSYAVGADTEMITKASHKPNWNRWDSMLKYIEQNRQIEDVVVSGGDTIYLTPEQLKWIGERLLGIGHIRKLRFASKVMAAVPHRLANIGDEWTETLIEISHRGKKLGKRIALHTHINHPNEISWITELAARRLSENGVTVRNQSVLGRKINDDVKTMSTLIRTLANMNIQPYYVYQADMVPGVEDMRTPLKTINTIEEQLRGTIAGFDMPQFVIDLPGGGGKRLANSYISYDESTGISIWDAPGVKPGQTFVYHDPRPYDDSFQRSGSDVPHTKAILQDASCTVA